ncbi:MAG: DUF2155 domain-containing protein [Holosporaceae bacterium]|jgi:hypothetical protein|nr:DUF2155 domain-containing protein [Holosporaceae bacterium]
MKKINPLSFKSSLFYLLSAGCLISVDTIEGAPKKRHLKEIIEHEDFGMEESSIWESNPIEIDNVNVQILDKISGKVHVENITLNSPKIFGSITLKLKRGFRNSPEDDKEISAFIEITEKGEVIFAKWLFASSPSVNLFSHPIYDIRIEF